MSVELLSINNVRIIENAEFEPSFGANLFTGANAAGKTSVLEAIDILSRGRSFRTHLLDRLVTTGKSCLTVAATLRGAHGPAIGIGLEKSFEGTRVRVRGQAASSIAELAALLPVQILHPDSHQLIQGGASHRRAYLDWGTFHVEQRFLTVWRRYQRALRQRNAALRSQASPDAASAWHGELSDTARQIDGYRSDYISTLTPIIDEYSEILPGAPRLEVLYRRGWAEDESLEALLDREVRTHWRHRHSRLGPHRAELEIRLNGKPAAGTASRGQQKLLAATLRLAQTRLFTQRTRRSCLFLIDDLPAELEARYRALLLRRLAELSSQVFMTAIERDDGSLRVWPESKVFHVEHGHIRETI